MSAKKERIARQTNGARPTTATTKTAAATTIAEKTNVFTNVEKEKLERSLSLE